MASGSQRQYNATFAIGAKLLGSFKGVMAQAQSRLERLNSSALKIGSTFKRMTLGLAALGGLAGYGISKVFGSLFEGSQEEAAEAEQRMRRLSVTLMQHNQIRLKGVAFAQKQAELIFKANEGLAHQGVIGKELLDSVSTQLAVYGYAPKRIAEMVGPLADVLVTSKGISATQEDAVGLADAWGRAVKTGMVRPMRQYGFILTDAEAKEFKSLKNAEKRNNWILAWAKGYRGVNIQAAATDLGKVQRFHNEISEFAKDIGRHMLPMQAEMADAWSKALPAAKPAIIGTLKQVGKAAAWAGRQIADMFTKLNPPEEQKQGLQLFTNYKDLIGRFNATTGRKDQSFNATTDVMNQWSRTGASELLTALSNVGDSLDALGPHFETNKQQAKSWGDWMAGVINDFGIKAAAMLQSDAQDIAGLGKAWEALKNDDTVTLLINNWNKSVSDLSDNLNATWAWMRINLTDQSILAGVEKLFKGMGNAVKDYLLKPLNDIKDAWNYIKGLSGPTPAANAAAPTANAAASVPNPASSVPGALANAKVQGMATGGIIRGHSLLQVAERNRPEAIIPLNRNPRSEGLLNYASRAMGVGGTTNNREMNVTYAPQITIQGNADQSTASAIDSALRKREQEFISHLKRATAQERRLSFDSAYS